MEIREILRNLSYSDLKNLFEKHLDWAKTNNRVSGTPKWFDEENTINLIGIRCNTEVEFNFGKYNDFLMVIFNKPGDTYDYQLLEVTVDPFRNKEGIAHLRQGVWDSYVVRPHKWATRYFTALKKTIDRWACCQDQNKVEIVRTDGKGNIIKTERGFFGINIHDNGGYNDSSLGCTILKNDTDYLERYLPYIYDIDSNKKVPVNAGNISYCLINHSQFEKYMEKPIEKEERASSQNGETKESIGAKGATKL